MEQLKEKRQITITGVVVPIDWDGNGNITAVEVCTPRDEEYFVHPDALGGDLLELYGSEVMITGAFSEDSEGNKVITVDKYELLGEYDEDEDEEEDHEDWIGEDDYEDLDGFGEDEEEWDE